MHTWGGVKRMLDPTLKCQGAAGKTPYPSLPLRYASGTLRSPPKWGRGMESMNETRNREIT